MKKIGRWLAGFVLVAFGGVVGLILAEGALRGYAALNPRFAHRLDQFDLLAVQIEPMGPYGYRQKPDGSFHYSNGTVATSNALGYRGPVVAIPKPPGVIRIVLVGGSTTHGWGVSDSETIDAYMRRQLAAEYPNRRFEVVNLAFDGYDSFQDYTRIRIDGLRFQPDVIIVNAGINDVRNARFAALRDHDRRTLLWAGTVAQLRAELARGGARLTTRLKHWFYVARFASMIRAAIRQRANARHEQEDTTGPHWAALDYFERNIRRIAAVAAKSHAALLLSTPPSAIPLDYAPQAVSPRGYWITDAQVTQEVRDSLSTRLRTLASALAADGQRVAYVPHHLDGSMFLDDAHLTPAGNAVEATEFDTAVIHILRLGATGDSPPASVAMHRRNSPASSH